MLPRSRTAVCFIFRLIGWLAIGWTAIDIAVNCRDCGAYQSRLGLANNTSHAKKQKPPGNLHLADVPLNQGRLRPSRVLGDRRLRHADLVTQVIPANNDHQIITSSLDGTARLWSRETGLEIRRFVHELDAVFDVQLIHGNRLLTCGSKKVCLWELDTGKKIRQFNPKGFVWKICAVPNTDRFITAGPGQTMKLWDINEVKPLHKFRGPVDEIGDVQVTADGNTLVGRDVQNNIFTFSIESGKRIKDITGNHADGVCLAIHPNQEKYVVCRDKRHVRFFAIEDEREIWTAPFNVDVSNVIWSSDGSTVGCIAADGFVYLLDAKTGNIAKKIAVEFVNPLYYEFALDQGTILSVGGNLVQQFRATDGARLFPGPKNDMTQNVALGEVVGWFEDPKNKNQILFCAADGIIRTIDVSSGKQRKLTIPAGLDLPTQGRVTSFDASPDGTRALIVTENEYLLIVNVADGRTIHLWNFGGEPSRDSLGGAKLINGGKTIVLYEENNVLTMFDAATGKTINETTIEFADDVLISHLATTEYGERFAVCDLDGSTIVFDATDGSRMYDLETGGFPNLSADGCTLISLSKRDRMRVWGSSFQPRQRSTPTATEFRNWINDLASVKYSVREAATYNLSHSGIDSLAYLDRTIAVNPEVEYRIRRIRKTIARLAKPTQKYGKHLRIPVAVDTVAISKTGKYWAIGLGTGASAEIVLGQVTPEGLLPLARASDGHSPRLLKFSDDDSKIISGNRDGTISIYRIRQANSEF